MKPGALSISPVALVVSASLAFATPSVDGTLDAGYGAARSVQQVQTHFGDASAGTVDLANGSELDAAHAQVENGMLYLFFAGNLESNWNKFELFLDTRAGGQNALRSDNADVDFGGLNRMAGLTFDIGFEPDYYFKIGGSNPGGGPYWMTLDGAELLSGGGGWGSYFGKTTAGSDGTLAEGTNPENVRVTLDNRNTAGVTAGCDAGDGAGVTTGLEFAIPLVVLDSPTGTIRVCAFVNSEAHTYMSNQVLPSLPVGTCNPGNISSVNFAALAGDQFFTLSDTVPVRPTSWGRVKSVYR